MRQLLARIDHGLKRFQSYRDLGASASDVMLFNCMEGYICMRMETGLRHHWRPYHDSIWSSLIVSWIFLLSTYPSALLEFWSFVFREPIYSSANELYCRKMFIGGLNWETTDRELALICRSRDKHALGAEANPAVFSRISQGLLFTVWRSCGMHRYEGWRYRAFAWVWVSYFQRCKNGQHCHGQGALS